MAGNDTNAEAQATVGGQAPAKKPSIMALVAEIGILTCFAIGAGGLFGMQVMGGSEHPAAPRGEAAVTPKQKPKYSEVASLKPLPPIMTNLAGAKGTWIRIEASVVFAADAASPNAMAAAIAEDMVAYLRTVPLSQIEGPSGFLHLHEDLNDRARIRSAGKVQELVIQALVLE